MVTRQISVKLPIFLMHDQPMACPKCSPRTGWVGENPQLHTCRCGFRFMVEEGEAFGFIETEDGWVNELDALEDGEE